MRFEYASEWIPSFGAEFTTLKRLNELGMDGWELVVGGLDIGVRGQYCLFKRAAPKHKSKRAK